MGGCASFARFVLVAFNVLFFIIGGVSLGLGIWVVVDKSSLISKLTQITSAVNTYNIPSLLSSAAYIFLVSGAVILVLSFCGCCGAWKKIRCLLILYGLIVLLIAILEIAVIITAAVFSNQVESTFKSEVKTTLTKSYNSGSLNRTADGTFQLAIGDAVTIGWDILQIELSCCGVDNGSDYDEATGWQNKVMYNATFASTPIRIPASCCQLNNATDATSRLTNKLTGKISLVNSSCPATLESSYASTGCYTTIKNLIKSNGVAVLAISAAIVGIQVFLVIFAFCLARLIQQDKA